MEIIPFLWKDIPAWYFFDLVDQFQSYYQSFEENYFSITLNSINEYFQFGQYREGRFTLRFFTRLNQRHVRLYYSSIHLEENQVKQREENLNYFQAMEHWLALHLYSCQFPTSTPIQTNSFKLFPLTSRYLVENGNKLSEKFFQYFNEFISSYYRLGYICISSLKQRQRWIFHFYYLNDQRVMAVMHQDEMTIFYHELDAFDYFLKHQLNGSEISSQ